MRLAVALSSTAVRESPRTSDTFATTRVQYVMYILLNMSASDVNDVSLPCGVSQSPSQHHPSLSAPEAEHQSDHKSVSGSRHWSQNRSNASIPSYACSRMRRSPKVRYTCQGIRMRNPDHPGPPPPSRVGAVNGTYPDIELNGRPLL